MEAAECEVAGRAGRVAAKGGAVHVEGEAATKSVITVGNLSRVAFHSGVGAYALDAEHEGRNQLEQK